MGSLKTFFLESIRIFLPLVILVAGVGGLIAVVMNRPQPNKAPETKIIPKVQTVAVKAYDGELSLEVDGLVVPYREVVIAAEVTGRVVYKDEQCKTGKHVRMGNFPALGAATVALANRPMMAVTELFPEHPWVGTNLVQIDPRDYQLEINRLTSELGQAKANLMQNSVDIANSRLLIKLAQKQVSLQTENYQDVKGLARKESFSLGKLRDALNSMVAAEQALESQRAQLNVNQAKKEVLAQAIKNVEDRLDKARVDLERTIVWSPLDGKVVQCDIERGGFVQRGAQLAKLEDTSAVEIRCNLTEDEVGWLWQQSDFHPSMSRQEHQLPNARVKVVYTFLNREFLWDGIVAHYDAAGFDKMTHTVPCRVLVSEPDRVTVPQPERSGAAIMRRPPRLLRNMYVKVRIYVQPQTPLLELPEKALKPGNVVWRVTNGKLEIVPVRVARIDNGRVFLAAEVNDLQPGDPLILSSIAFATEGVKVQEK